MEMENLNRFSEIYRVVLQINPILSGSFSEEYGDDGGDDYKMVMMMNMMTMTVVMVMLPMVYVHFMLQLLTKYSWPYCTGGDENEIGDDDD